MIVLPEIHPGKMCDHLLNIAVPYIRGYLHMVGFGMGSNMMVGSILQTRILC